MVQPLSKLTPCLYSSFREKIANVTLFDKFGNGARELYHFAVQLSPISRTSMEKPYTSYQIVMVAGGKCSLAYSGSQDEGPLHQYFEENLARQLALSRYRYQIKVEGKAPIYKLLSSQNLILPREQAWALKQLGFSIPKGVKDVK